MDASLPSGRFLAPKRLFVPGYLLVLLASGCVLEDHDPVVTDDGGPGATLDGGFVGDGKSTTDGPRSPDGTTPLDGQSTDGGAGGSTNGSDARSDGTNPPSQDGSALDAGARDTSVVDMGGAADRGSQPDTPGTTPDVSTGTDGSVVDVTMPPTDAGPTCPAPQIDCNGKCVSPTDPKTCGSCTHDCTNLAHVSGPTTCSAGACVVPPSSCASGWAHCSSNADDGCEVDITKPEHCGSCTTMCGSGTPLCAQDSADAGASGFQCKSQCSAPSPDLCGMSCVNKTTDPLNCGMCDHKCDPPVSHGQAGCAASMCAPQCNQNYSYCTSTNDCVDLKNDVANCGTCGHGCDPPAAHGKAICSNSMCSPSCDSGYPNYCSSTNTCVNLSNDTANCGTCGKPCTPPTNGTVTGCSGGTCQTACNPGYEDVGGVCTQLSFYIADTGGDDTGPGTEAAPFKTWNRAATRASVVAGAKIYFKSGAYSGNTTGEDFTVKIPNGATVATSGGKVRIDGLGVAGLQFLGSGTVNGGSTVDGLTLNGFNGPLSATSGTQTVTNVTLTEMQAPLYVGGGNMTISGFAMSSTEISAQFNVADGTLTLSNGSIKTNVSSCVATSPSANQVVNTGKLVANQLTSDGLISMNGGTATFTGLTASTFCSGQNRSLYATGGANVTINSSQLSQWINFDNSTIKLRGSTLDGQIRIDSSGTYDFGKAIDKGNNKFNAGIWLVQANTTVNAAGNKWIPSEGVADANGNITSQTVFGPQDNANYRIDDMTNTSSIVF